MELDKNKFIKILQTHPSETKELLEKCSVEEIKLFRSMTPVGLYPHICGQMDEILINQEGEDDACQ